MLKLDPLRIALGVFILIVVGAAAWWVSEPWRAQRANKAAAEVVTTKSTESIQKGAAQAVNANAQVEKRVVVVEERERVRTPRVRDAADPYGEFLAGVCESRLYKDDPGCRSAGRAGGADRGAGGGEPPM